MVKQTIMSEKVCQEHYRHHCGTGASRRGDVLPQYRLYGATSGQLFVAGRAGERFAIRNSGALAVVEELASRLRVYDRGVALILGPVD